MFTLWTQSFSALYFLAHETPRNGHGCKAIRLIFLTSDATFGLSRGKSPNFARKPPERIIYTLTTIRTQFYPQIPPDYPRVHGKRNRPSSPVFHPAGSEAPKMTLRQSLQRIYMQYFRYICNLYTAPHNRQHYRLLHPFFVFSG